MMEAWASQRRAGRRMMRWDRGMGKWSRRSRAEESVPADGRLEMQEAHPFLLIQTGGITCLR